MIKIIKLKYYNKKLKSFYINKYYKQKSQKLVLILKIFISIIINNKKNIYELYLT